MEAERPTKTQKIEHDNSIHDDLVRTVTVIWPDDEEESTALSRVKTLLDNGADINHISMQVSGYTILCRTIFARYNKVVAHLLQHPDIDVNLHDASGDTPLLTAIGYSNIEAMKLLLQHERIDVNVGGTFNNYSSPLDAAIDHPDSNVLTILLEHSTTTPRVEVTELDIQRLTELQNSHQKILPLLAPGRNMRLFLQTIADVMEC